MADKHSDGHLSKDDHAEIIRQLKIIKKAKDSIVKTKKSDLERAERAKEVGNLESEAGLESARRELYAALVSLGETEIKLVKAKAKARDENFLRDRQPGLSE